jgi:hypothetical protein
MKGQTDSWTDGRMEGCWTDRQTDGPRDGWMDRQTDKQTDGRTEGWLDKWTVKWMDGRMERQTDR